jgi:MoaA/NifB/PqqE/SkfB family radical SAM enzyme
LTIATNGSLPDIIQSACRRLCRLSPKPLRVQVSLDGLENAHDCIRGLPGSFKKALATLEGLKEVKKENRNLSFLANVTLMRENADQIGALLDFLKKSRIATKITPVRGNSFSTFGLSEKMINKDYGPSSDSGLETAGLKAMIDEVTLNHPGYFDPVQRKRLQVMSETLRCGRRQMPCFAGYEDAVIYSDGSLGLCEQLLPFGKISEWDGDLIKAWNSLAAMEHRAGILSCACIHGCNIGTALKKTKPWLFLGKILAGQV